MIAMPGERADNREKGAPPDPTLEEIRERAASIQKHWSNKTRKRRCVHPVPEPWLPPGVDMADIAANAKQPDSN